MSLFRGAGTPGSRAQAASPRISPETPLPRPSLRIRTKGGEGLQGREHDNLLAFGGAGRALLRGDALGLHLLQVLFRVLLEFLIAALAAEIDALPLVVGVDIFIDVASQNRANRLGLGLLGQEPARP